VTVDRKAVAYIAGCSLAGAVLRNTGAVLRNTGAGARVVHILEAGIGVAVDVAAAAGMNVILQEAEASSVRLLLVHVANLTSFQRHSQLSASTVFCQV